MAKLYGENASVDFASTNLMSFGKSFSRLNGQPLDKSEVWYDMTSLREYALTDAAYVGQKVFYVDTTNSRVIHYSIGVNGGLDELGATPIGDNKSIVVNPVTKTISLKGVPELDFVKRDEKGEPVKDDLGNVIKLRYQPLMTEAGLTWIVPSATTVEGLAAEIEALKRNIAPLIVTLDPEKQIASNSSLEMKAHIDAGGSVYLDTGDKLVAMQIKDGAVARFVNIKPISSSINKPTSGIIQTWIVYDDYSYDYKESHLVSSVNGVVPDNEGNVLLEKDILSLTIGLDGDTYYIKEYTDDTIYETLKTAFESGKQVIGMYTDEMDNVTRYSMISILAAPIREIIFSADPVYNYPCRIHQLVLEGDNKQLHEYHKDLDDDNVLIVTYNTDTNVATHSARDIYDHVTVNKSSVFLSTSSGIISLSYFDENWANFSIVYDDYTATHYMIDQDGLVIRLDDTVYLSQSEFDTHVNNQENPHNVTKEQVGLGNVTNDAQVKRSEMGVAGGVATLNNIGVIPAHQLPSYVDDILEGRLVNNDFFPSHDYTLTGTLTPSKNLIDLWKLLYNTGHDFDCATGSITFKNNAESTESVTLFTMKADKDANYVAYGKSVADHIKLTVYITDSNDQYKNYWPLDGWPYSFALNEGDNLTIYASRNSEAGAGEPGDMALHSIQLVEGTTEDITDASGNIVFYPYSPTYTLSDGTVLTHICPDYGKIYVDTHENKTYRWSGTTYSEVPKSLSLGSTDSTAYPGNLGAANAEKLLTIEQGAQVNDIEEITINEESLSIKDKKVNIPLAGSSTTGVVKLGDEFETDDDGKLLLKSISISKIAQGEILVLDGGNASDLIPS